MKSQLIGNLKRGLLFIVSAPAGTGKSTLVNMLVKEFPQHMAESCSLTTRPPREGEIDKVHYEFVSQKEFSEKIAQDAFLEYALVFDNYYGTLRRQVEELQEKGKHVFLVIDTQGAMNLREKVKGTFIFISPPSMKELEKRLFKRNTETQENISERLKWAQKEIELAEHYDYNIINDDLLVTYQVLLSIVVAEEHKRSNLCL